MRTHDKELEDYEGRTPIQRPVRGGGRGRVSVGSSDYFIAGGISAQTETSGTIEDCFNKGAIEINANAFSNCTKLTQVSIPASVKGIGHCAFEVCPNLRSVYFEGNAPSGGNYLFDPRETSDSPDVVIVYYHEGTKGWKKKMGGLPHKEILGICAIPN